jgi:hypothetical protein
MPELGDTFRCSLSPRHIWIIISDPNVHDQIVLVNITTLTQNCVDDVCILQPADYPPYLTQTSTIAYSRFNIGHARGIEALVRSNHFFQMPPIPANTLLAIIDGARRSNELPNAAKLLLPPPTT